MFDLKMAVFPYPLFVGSKNFTEKVDVRKHSGLRIQHDKKENLVWVTWNGESAFMSATNVMCYPANLNDYGFTTTPTLTAQKPIETHTSHPMKANISKSAQVTDPTRGMR